jgi:hypothetical protein
MLPPLNWGRLHQTYWFRLRRLRIMVDDRIGRLGSTQRLPRMAFLAGRGGTDILAAPRAPRGSRPIRPHNAHVQRPKQAPFLRRQYQSTGGTLSRSGLDQTTLLFRSTIGRASQRPETASDPAIVAQTATVQTEPGKRGMADQASAFATDLSPRQIYRGYVEHDIPSYGNSTPAASASSRATSSSAAAPGAASARFRGRWRPPGRWGHANKRGLLLAERPKRSAHTSKRLKSACQKRPQYPMVCQREACAPARGANPVPSWRRPAWAAFAFLCWVSGDLQLVSRARIGRG